MPELTENFKRVLLALSVPGVYCLLVLLGRELKRNQGVRLGWLYHLFALALAIYAPARLMDLNGSFLRHLGGALVVLGAMVFIALVDRYLWELHFQQRHGVNVPKFLRELARMVILLIAVFLVLELGYGQTVNGLLVAPGIAAVVIGLAMQDLLGNIIAGVALQVSKSFDHGDWLVIDNRYAEVIEVNWRCTRFRTTDDISIEIPNRELTRLNIVNLNRPQRLHAVRLTLLLDYSTPPTRTKDVLLHAVTNAKGVCPEPKPKVFLKNFGDNGIEYEMKFWIDSPGAYSDICDAVRTHVWYALRRHGIRMPYPTRTLQIERPPRDRQQEAQSAARQILRQQPLFRCLSDEELDALLPSGQVVHFGLGEHLIHQGEQGQSMFILVEGDATVVAQRNGTAHQVATLSAGDCFGEMSLLTGERRSATVIAKTDCTVVEIDKPVLANSLKANPTLLSQLSDLLAKRQMQTEGILATETRTEVVMARQTKYAEGFMSKLQAFFEL